MQLHRHNRLRARNELVGGRCSTRPRSPEAVSPGFRDPILRSIVNSVLDGSPISSKHSLAATGTNLDSIREELSKGTTLTHYKSNLRDLEFNLFEMFGAGDRMGSAAFPEMDVETA